MELNDLRLYLEKDFPDITLFPADLEKFVFEEKVELMCFYCGRYGRNWRCPPHLPKLDYKKVFSEFDHLAFLASEMSVTKDTYDEIRTESTMRVHKAVLVAEKILYDHNISFSLSFIGGGCKLCRNGCAEDRCRNPYNSRSPLEATGLNVIKTLRLHGFDICFPVTDVMKRVGLILWSTL